VSRTIAFFDFDGTITTRDSLLEFIKYVKGKPAFYFGFALHSPILVAYKLGVFSNQRAKEMMLRYFFRNMPVEQFNSFCRSFAADIVPSLVRPKAAKEITALQNAGAQVVVVSASPENWVHYWCAENGLTCIATRLINEKGVLTGRIDGVNCHGEEKVRRIRESFDLSQFNEIYCYGDTSGDKPMLALGTKHFFRPFR